jgi:hypothetical protein
MPQGPVHHTPTWWNPSPWDELDTIDRWHQHQEQALGAVEDITPDQARSAAEIARVVPRIGPGVLTSLARFGTSPESPVTKFVAGQTALMNRKKDMYLGIMGTVVDPSRIQQGNPQNRLRETLRAANSLGMIDDEGRLHEPDAGAANPQSWVYQEVRDAFSHAGIEMPFVDRMGRPQRRRLTSEHRESVGWEQRRENRAGEAAAIQRQSLQNRGFKSVDEIAVENPAMRNIIQRAHENGWVDEDGFLTPPTATQTFDEDDPDYQEQRQFWRQVQDKFQRERIPLPFMDIESGPTVIHTEEDNAYWESMFQQPTQEDEGGGGPGTMDVIMGDVAAPDISVGGIDVSPAQDALRQTTQQSMTVLNAIPQEAQGVVRNIYAAAHGQDVNWTESQSDLGIILGQEHGWDDIGRGYFVDPESPVAIDRTRREATRGQIAGHNITLGRILASSMPDTPLTEPGSIGYNLVSGMTDMATAIATDPTTYIAGGLGALNRARTTFAAGDDAIRSAGALRGITASVRRPNAQSFFDGPVGSKAVEAIAQADNSYDIFVGLGRRARTGPLARELANISEPADVRAAIEPHLGTTFRRTTEVWDPPLAPQFGVRKPSAAARRLLHQIPGGRDAYDTFDLEGTARSIESELINARAPEQAVRSNVSRILNSRNRSDLYSAVRDSRGAVEEILVAHGLDRSHARAYNSMFNKMSDEAGKWFIDEVGSDAQPWDHVMLGGDDMATNLGPHLTTELMGRYIEPPDWQRIARVTESPLARVFTTKHTLWNVEKMTGDRRFLPALLHHGQMQIWRPVTLARAAFTVRNIGELQGRMAAESLPNMFTHPADFIAWAVGRRGKTFRGTPLEEAESFKRAMTNIRGANWDESPNMVRSHEWDVFAKGMEPDADFIDGWADELAMLYQDPVARTVAQHDTLDDAVDWLWTRYQSAGDDSSLGWLHDFDNTPHMLDSREKWQRYAETIVDRINIKTGGNDDLLDMVRRGSLNEESIFTPDGMSYANNYKSRLRGYFDDAPSHVKGEKKAFLPRQQQMQSDVGRGLNRAADFAFSWLGGRPENYFVNSPVYRNYFFRNVAHLAQWYDGSSDDLVDLFRQAGLGSKIPGSPSRRIMNDLQNNLGRAVGRSDEDFAINLDEIEHVAHMHTLDDTQNLLYGLVQKRQIEKAMELVSPFGAAWSDMFQTWGRLIRADPHGAPSLLNFPGSGTFPRRIYQGVETAEESGYFYENEYGELVFTYPGSEWLTEQALDVPIPMTGRVEGLSFMTQVMPGIGPALQVPVAQLIGNKPQFADLYNELIPYGAPGDEDPGSAFNVLNYAPPWMKRAFSVISEQGFDPESDRLYNNTVLQTARYLTSTGQYDLADPAEFQRMMEDAATKAKYFYLIRSVGSFVAPSAPSPEWLLQTDDNGLKATAILAKEYRDLQDQDFETADQLFLDKYGDDVLTAMTPLSKGLSWGINPSQDFLQWSADNPDLRNEFPSIYGFFGPQNEDFEYNVYAAQFNNGERESISPDEWMRLTQHMIANRMYHKARRIVGNNRTFEQSAWLNDLKSALQREYPGFNNVIGVPQGPEAEPAAADIGRLLEDHPEVARTGIGRAVSTYLEARQVGHETARSRGIQSYATAEGAVDIRDWLRTLGEQLSRETPAFRRIYSYVFEGELSQGSEVAEAEQIAQEGVG